MMNGNAELLNFIYQNSQMGTETVPRLLELVKNEKMRAHLQNQLKGYEDFQKKARSLLQKKS